MASILIGHASQSESGTINGTKGDSTGKEVCTRTWYSKPWDYMAIYPDADVREKHASACEDGCANNNIGYGQSDRNTLNTLAKACDYDLSKVGLCNTDCSAFMNVCAVAAGTPNVTYGSNGWTTSTMKSALTSAGYKIITDSTYLTNSAYCVRGAIYVKSGSHTVCGLTNGSKYAKTLEAAGITSSSSSSSTSSSSTTSASSMSTTVSWTGTVTATKLNVRTGPGTSYSKLSSYPQLTKGDSVGVCDSTTDTSGSTWYYILIESTYYGYVSASYISKSSSSSSTSSSASSSSSVPSYSVGTVYTLQVELKVRSGPGKSYSALSHSDLTTSGQNNDTDKDGALDKGTRVTCQAVQNNGDDIWIKCPSGWLAAYYQGNIYIK